jgi:hypothetical protein
MAQPAVTPTFETEADSTPVDIMATKISSGKKSKDHPQHVSEAIPNFGRVLDDAMLLLTHAAEQGVEVDETTRTSILAAKAAANPDWSYPGAANLLAALATLAAKLRPVTADSLRASRSDLVNPDMRSLRMWTCFLAVPIVLFSVLSFLATSMSNAIRTDITTANELLVKLRAELGTPSAPTAGTPEKPALPQGLNEGDVITQLQLYASTVRAIDARSRQLNWFVMDAEHDPFANYRWNARLSPKERDANQQTLKTLFQLPVGLPNMPDALDKLTATYQDVRSFAQDILGLVSVYYGAVTACLLPILYALLGTCAFLLRNFEEELRTMTFAPSSKTNWARFLIAGIGGGVVGLFNFAFSQGESISPLAVAFLVGYAVDVFFSFLEGLLQAFTKSKSPVRSPAAALSEGQ